MGDCLEYPGRIAFLALVSYNFFFYLNFLKGHCPFWLYVGLQFSLKYISVLSISSANECVVSTYCMLRFIALEHGNKNTQIYPSSLFVC